MLQLASLFCYKLYNPNLQEHKISILYIHKTNQNKNISMQYQWSCVTKTTHVLILMCLSNQLIFKLCSVELWNSVGLREHVSFTVKCVNTFLIILN